jgi:hypothetical protein
MGKRSVAKRKRGRPPAGEFSGLTKVKSVRMTERLLQLLEQGRKERSKKLKREIKFSQEILYRLQNSFDREHDQARDPAIRAFCFLFSELAQVICVNPALVPDWRFDPWLFQTFKLAVAKLLDRFQPAGKKTLPEFWRFVRETPDIDGLPSNREERKRITESPEAMADHAVEKVLSDFSNPQRVGQMYKGGKDMVGKLPKASDRRILGALVKEWDATYYGMNAVRDLGPKQKSQGGKS